MLKLLHTSDWHLGKKLFKAERIEEQKLFLEWLLTKIDEEKIDYLLIAGDIFDSPHPPNEALKLYFDFLHELAKINIQTIIIGGNHDSGTFIDAPANLLLKQKLHVSGQLSSDLKKHIHELKIENSDESVGIVTLPYFRNWEIHQLGRFWEIAEGEDFGLNTIKRFLKETSGLLDHCSKKILLSHHLFGMYSAAGSEQAIGLSGVDSIPNNLLEGLFDYVALGHIHKPQIIKKENPIIYYSGSPIAMRFSETMKKSLSMITVSENELTQKLIEIPRFRELIHIECNEEEIDQELTKLNKVEIGKLKHFVEVIVHIKNPNQGLLEKIKNNIEPKHELLSTSFLFESDEEVENELYGEIKRGLSLPEIFDHFYRSKFKDTDGPDEKLKEDFLDIMKRTQESQ